MTFKEQINQLVKKGWSYRKLADELGVSKTTVSRWAKGENEPAFKFYYAMIESLYQKEIEQPVREQQKHGFRVGDRVQFKTWEEMEKEFGLSKYGNLEVGPDGLVFSKDMKNLCGTYATITGFYNCNRCHLTDFTATGTTNWRYSTAMLKPVSVKVRTLDDQIAELESKLAELKAQKEASRWVFTEDEKVILRNLPEEYKWITRDEDGMLGIYTIYPERGADCWHCGRFFVIYQHLFQCIQWSDTEPCEFRKFIGE